MAHRVWQLTFALLFFAATFSSTVAAATLPAGFTETQITGLTSPTAMAFAPDGRLFICQQGGQLRVVKNNALLATPFLTVTVNSSGERGLLGIAFDPNFNANQYIYVYYTATAPAIHNRVSRFTANGDVALANSETVLLDLNNLSTATNHNGGAMHFGPDGKLYVAVGENANSANAQSFGNLLGKMLRINTDPGNVIPTDNPFYNDSNVTGQNKVIWALGLRNPYTFNFQTGTGRMFINDVGQSATEEINDGIAGSNYGWPTCEGICSNAGFRNPIYTYNHSNGTPTGCAITGGVFYNPATRQFPDTYAGKYFFADYCSSFIRYIDPASPAASNAFATDAAAPVDLQVASDGSLYYLARGTGAVYKVQYPAGQVSPTITQQPQNQTVAANQTATFTTSATGSTPLTFQWQLNGVDIIGANASSYTTPPVSSSDNGAVFRVVVKNSFGAATSNAATLGVTNPAPVSLQFDAAIYRVSEGGASASVNVSRTGDASSVVTVDYQTSDNTASQRTDYTLANGTLTFNAGEMSKSFVVLITDNARVDGDRTINLTLANPGGGGATLGAQRTALLTINDNDTTQPTTNPIDDTGDFVRQHYYDFLNRLPDAGGFAYWTDLIGQCSSTDAQCLNSKRVSVSAAFFVEQEFQDTGGYVYRFYKAAYGQRPTYAQFMPDRSRVVGGANLEAGKQAFAEAFVLRPEFIAKYPATLSAAGFIDALLQTMRQGSAVDLSSQRDALINDYTVNKNRARILRLLVDDAAFKQAEYNNAFVLTQYFGYLRREPDASGYQFWLDVLNNRVPNNYRSMVCAFITSAEYQDRFSSVRTHNDSVCGQIGQ